MTDYIDRALIAEAENKRLREDMQIAFSVLDDIEEINPSNYDHDLVCQMNTGFCEVYSILKAALEKDNA